MKRSVVYSFWLIAVAVGLIAVGGISLSLIAHAGPEQRVVINGQDVPLVKQAQKVGTPSGSQQINLSVGLRMRNVAGLNALLHNLYDPQSAQYHQFLSPQSFAAQFDPTTAQQQQVTAYLRSQGLTVTHVSSNGLLIDAHGTVAQAETTFQVSLNNYRLGPRTFYANGNEPTLPASIASLVLSVGGLDNSVALHPMSHLMPQATSGYGPTDLDGSYDETALHQAGINGQSQTVAVFELDGYQSSDIQQFLSSNQLGNPSITNETVDGYNGAAGEGAIEVELDIEVVAEIAPQASQIVYEGPNSTQGVNDTYNQIVTENKAQVVTTSWGECEAQSGTSELQTLDGIFKQASAQGIAVYAAAGDSGAYDCNDTNLAVDSPADDPYVTGVGGTNLQESNGVYGSESVWSDPTDTSRSAKGSGGGGGLSNTFTQPSWQVGPGVQNQYSNGNREVPDVSADADPQTGYAIYCTVSAAGCPSTGNIVVGGTSAAAPLWAGSTTLIDQYLQQQGKSRLGSPNPTLYALANSQQSYAPFHDVTSGTNLYYPATAGYDLASGLGSPDVYNIARDVAGGNVPTPPPGPTPTPTPGPTPTPAPSPSPIPTTTPPPTTGGALVQNGGFEQGVSPWQESSAGGYELVDSKNPHTGSYSAYLCGYSYCNDVIAQSFKVPAGTVSVSYWWYASTTRTAHTCQDTFTAQLLDSNGHVIGSLQQVCNTNATRKWQQVTFNATSALSAYAGQTVTLSFSAQTGSTHATTSFFIDDVSVTG